MSVVDTIRTTVRSIDAPKPSLTTRLGIQTTVSGLFFLMAVGSASAQQGVCDTAIGTFTNDAITGLLGLALALVFVGMVVGFGGRSIAFSGNLMGKLSAMVSNSLTGLIGLVFVAVLFSWLIGYAPIDIPQGCVPLSG